MHRPVGLTVVALCSAALFAGPLFSQTYATGDPRNPASAPAYPAVCTTLTAQFSTSQRSSPPASDDTSRLQTALNQCAGTGTSVVLAPSGSSNAFYTGTITVNGEGLVVDSGVTLEASNNYTSQSELVLIEGNNSFLGGSGAIDGRGDLLSGGTPRLVQATSASSLNITDITLEQALHPNLYIEGGTDITVWGITVRTPANRTNADGIDLDSLSDATVANSSVEAGDDGIAVKTNSGAASNITVKNSQFYGTHGLSIGSQTMYGVTNVLFTGNYVYGQDLQGTVATDDNGIRIKTDPTCGGTVQQVTYSNTCMTGVKHLIILNTHYGSCSGTSGTPDFQDIIVDGAYATNSVSGAYETFNGYSASYPINVYLGNVDLDNTTQSGDQYTNAYLDNSNVVPSGTGVTTGTWTASGSVPVCSFTTNPDFGISASPTSQTVTPGSGASYTVSVSALNGYTGTVNLSASGLPSGATASFSPSSISGGAGSSTMAVSTSSTTPGGTYTVTITGTDSSGTPTHSTNVTLVVNAPQGDFGLSASPSSQTVTPGSSTSYTVGVSPINGFSGAVSFSVSGLPNQASASFNPSSVTGSGNTTMTVTTGKRTKAGTYPLTITGSSGSLTHSTSVSLVVQ